MDDGDYIVLEATAVVRRVEEVCKDVEPYILSCACLLLAGSIIRREVSEVAGKKKLYTLAESLIRAPDDIWRPGTRRR